MKKGLTLILCLLLASSSMAKGITDEYNLEESLRNFSTTLPYKFDYKQIIAPTALIALGSLSLYTYNVKNFDDISSKLISNGHGKLTFDDYLQYSPTLIMWGMDAAGCKPRHKFKQQTSILAISAVSLFAMIQVSKISIGRLRPDHSTHNSFPSGHTATAFMCAEILRQEFGHYSPWVGITGYALASTTAYMRVYNRRHWATDTIAGAGVGILGAKIGYWLAPKLNQALWGDVSGYQNQMQASLTPYSSGGDLGVNFSIIF